MHTLSFQQEAMVIDMSATSLAGMTAPWAEKAAAVASTMTGARGEPETDGLLSRSAMGIRCVSYKKIILFGGGPSRDLLLKLRELDMINTLNQSRKPWS